MKHLSSFALLLFFALACKFSFDNKTTETPKTNINKPAAGKTEIPNKQPTQTPAESPLLSLKKSKDKTATEIKFFSNPQINARLEKLMGKDYQTMKKFWNVETPLEIDGNVLRLTGCEAHNCGSNYYVIFMDAANDNINVHHILEETLKSYNERNEINLPKRFAEEFEQDTNGLHK